MNPSPVVSPKHSHVESDKCHHHGNVSGHKAKSKFNKLINILEKISAVALGAFSAYVNWKLFVPFFFAGVCIGIYNYAQETKSSDHVHAGSSCVHGVIEQLTGVKLPPIVSLAANVALTLDHIDHHSSVFVPIVGISLGAWVGNAASHYGVLMHKKISLCITKQPALKCANLASSI